MDTLAYRNGKFIPKSQLTVEYSDLGFERGFAVFEYCRERGGRIPFLEDHLHRLLHSMSLLRFEEPASDSDIRAVVEKLQAKNNLSDSYFKILISGTMEGRRIVPAVTIYQDIFQPYPESFFKQGIALILQEYEKPFPEYKTTFYLGSLKEWQRLLDASAEDVLFYANNTIRECSRCNIFIVKNGLIYTPEKNLLKGVTRKHVIRCAMQTQMVIEKDISVRELFNADEIFITSTTRNITPVVRIEDQAIANGAPGPVTIDLSRLFNQYCERYGIQ